MRQCPVCHELAEDSADVCPRCDVGLSPPNPLLGKLIDAKYRIEAVLGSGGQGSVYRATHVHLDRAVAFKVLRIDAVGSPDHVKRFQREAQVLAQLSHPHVVTVYDFGLSPDAGFFLVMELLEGETLRARLRLLGAAEPVYAVSVMQQICQGVQAMHARGITHRDLKPENIFLERIGLEKTGNGRTRVKLLDFGIAKLQEAIEATDDADLRETAEITTTGSIMGSPAYLSPEQCLGERVDARSDIYTLGVVLYEMLTSRVPFPSRNIAEVIRRHINETPIPPVAIRPNIPPGLDAIVARALSKDKEHRFQTVEDLRRAIERVALFDTSSPGFETQRIETGDEPLTTDLASTGRAIPVPRPDAEPPRPPAPARPEAGTPANNLPQPMTAFIGRREHIEAVKDLLSRHRLVTLTGPGGSGKTRLALQVAWDLLPRSRAGVFFVELASVSSASLLPQAISEALGIPERGTRPLGDAVREFIHTRNVLLLLDNCEHLIDGCASLASTLLSTCPHLQILATSQEMLDISGEAAWRLSSLSLPETEKAGMVEAGASEAVQLFVDRARLGVPGFALTDENTPAIVRIVHQLDGIPLAVELAAARVRALSPEQIAARLEDRFRLLTGGGRTVGLRQRTLRGAMDWSYDLLSEDEKTLFRRLSCFVGGFTLETAEAVCSGAPATLPAGARLDLGEVLELLGDLIRKSLVFVHDRGTESRYDMLETIRKYGAERLAEANETAWLRRNHFDHFFALALKADLNLFSTRQQDWMARLSVEHDNVRLALEYCRSSLDAETLLRFSAALSRFWGLRAHLREGQAWLREAVAACGDDRSANMAAALRGAGRIAGFLGDYDSATTCHERAADLWVELGDEAGVAESLNDLGIVAQWHGDHARAEGLHSRALEIGQRSGDTRSVALALKNLGVIARYRGDGDRAGTLFRESLELFRLLKDTREIASTVNNLSVTAAARGRLDEALELGEENLDLCRRIGDRRGLGIALINLGETAIRLALVERAAACLREGLALCEEIGERRLLAYAAESVIGLALSQGRYDDALRLAGATSTLRQDIGAPLATAELDELNRLLESARIALGEPAAAEVYETGRQVSSGTVTMLALDMLSA